MGWDNQNLSYCLQVRTNVGTLMWFMHTHCAACVNNAIIMRDNLQAVTVANINLIQIHTPIHTTTAWVKDVFIMRDGLRCEQ